MPREISFVSLVKRAEERNVDLNKIIWMLGQIMSIGQFEDILRKQKITFIQPIDTKQPKAYRPFGRIGFFTFFLRRWLAEADRYHKKTK